MVNPNDPNSEPDGIPPSDPTPDSSSENASDTPSSESGPISDELFDSLSELLGDSPAADEPVSLPDLDLWSDQPAEPAPSFEQSIDELVEDPTPIQFDSENAAETAFSVEEISDEWVEDLTPIQFDAGIEAVSEPDEPILSSEPGDVVSIEPTLPISNLSEDTQTSPGIREEQESDPWVDQPAETASSIDPISDSPDVSSNIEPPIEDQPQDIWADTAPSAPINRDIQGAVPDISPETPISSPDQVDPAVASSLPMEDPSSDWTASDDVLTSPEPTPEDVNDVVVEPATSLETEDVESLDRSDETSNIPVEEIDSPAAPPLVTPIYPPESVADTESSRDDEPVPMPVTAGSAASPPSYSAQRPPSSGDLGPLSSKLPLNRYQSVGLLVALSTLGTITYLGVTGDNSTQSLITPETPSLLIPDSSSSPDIAVVPTQPAVTPTPSTDEATPKSNKAVQRPQTVAKNVPAVPVPSNAVPTPSKATPAPSKLDISDVPVDHWAYPFITKLHAQGVIPNYPDGKFQPDKPVTRAELAAQIQRAFTSESGQRPLEFSDIPANYWAAKAIEGAVDKKFMSGYPATDFQADEQIPRFQPDKKVPRYEVLVALVSGLELDPNSPESSLQRFQDQEKLPDWSKGQISASTLGGIVVNHPDPVLLAPDRNATRAEVAVMIHQALVQKGQLEPIESEFVIDPES